MNGCMEKTRWSENELLNVKRRDVYGVYRRRQHSTEQICTAHNSNLEGKRANKKKEKLDEEEYRISNIV